MQVRILNLIKEERMKKPLFITPIVLFLGCSLLFAGELKEPEMVLVPKGSFEIGNKDYRNAQPVHKVILSNDFYIGKYEVINQQYADMLNYAWAKGALDKEAFAEGSKKKEARSVSKMPQKLQDVFDEHSQITFENGIFKPHAGKENFPVLEVTWYGAAFYCNMLSEKEGLAPLYNLDNWTCEVYGKSGYRLPTEAEWEYAAKYDDGRIYPWGNTEPDDTYANIKKSIKAQADVFTTAVGAYSPKGDTKLGIADMAGNAAEWCNDWYDISYSEKTYETDPKGSAAGLMVYAAPMKKYLSMKVVRGASFLHDLKFREGMGVPFLIDSVTRPEAFTTSGRSFDCVNMSRQVEGFRIVKVVAPVTAAAQATPVAPATPAVTTPPVAEKK
jgi:formylglycine-generating enzyme required for sulfatase activity